MYTGSLGGYAFHALLLAADRQCCVQVARLAKQLPQGDLQRQAAALGGSSGTAKPAVSAQDLDEDDLM